MKFAICFITLTLTTQPNIHIEEIYQPTILNIKNKLPEIINNLYSLKSIKKDSSKKELENLSGLLLELKQNYKKMPQKDLFHSALALGEYVRKTNKGNWILLERLGSKENSTYFTPAIVYSNNSIFLLLDYLESFFVNESITPENYSNLPFIKNPGLKIGNSFFKANFLSFKIIN